MFDRLFNFYELTKAAIILVVIIAILNLFFLTFTRVDGPSMNPTLQTGQTLFIDKLSYRFSSPAVGEVIDLRFPGDPEHKRYVKRVLAVPGQTVEMIAGQLIIDGNSVGLSYNTRNKIWHLAANQYFLVGDNRQNSTDSRLFGPVEQRFFIGKARLILWPPSDFKVL